MRSELFWAAGQSQTLLFATVQQPKFLMLELILVAAVEQRSTNSHVSRYISPVIKSHPAQP